VNDAVDTFNGLPQAVGMSQVSQGYIRIEPTDLAIIARLTDHQPGSIPIARKLTGDLITDKPGSPGDQQFHFLGVGRHVNPFAIPRVRRRPDLSLPGDRSKSLRLHPWRLGSDPLRILQQWGEINDGDPVRVQDSLEVAILWQLDELSNEAVNRYALSQYITKSCHHFKATQFLYYLYTL
jgi:hypothetical protein